MNLAKLLIHHSYADRGDPKVSSSEDPQNRRNAHYQVEMADHEVSRMQHDIDGRLSQKEAADAATDKHRDKAQSKQRSGIDSQLRPIQAESPYQHDDGGRDSYNQCWERECQRRVGIHTADEHVMPVDHVTQNGQSSKGVNKYPLAQHRLTHIRDQDMRDDSHAWNDCNIDLWMPKEPEQVLPEQSRATRVR